MAKKKRKKLKPKKIKRPRCKVCGFRIRGKNHDEGRHHQEAAKKLT